MSEAPEVTKVKKERKPRKVNPKKQETILFDCVLKVGQLSALLSRADVIDKLKDVVTPQSIDMLKSSLTNIVEDLHESK